MMKRAEFREVGKLVAERLCCIASAVTRVVPPNACEVGLMSNSEPSVPENLAPAKNSGDLDGDDRTALTIAIEAYRSDGGDQAKEDILEAIQERLRALASRMLRGERVVRRWEQTDDFAQLAMVKLWNSLDQIEVRDTPSLLALTARHMRWMLIDHARKHRGPMSEGANHATVHVAGDGNLIHPIDGQSQQTVESDHGELHEAVEALSGELRAAIDLVYYHSMTYAEAAKILGVAEKTIQRRIRRAQLELQSTLGDEQPPLV